MTGNAPEHEPVLLREVVEFLQSDGGLSEEGCLVDCTLGLGGYSERILRTFPKLHVCGLDRDKAAIELTTARLSEYASRFSALHVNFGNMDEVLSAEAPFDAFVFDLGVSNMQLTGSERGFSFQNDGPLDMRMNPDGSGNTAAEVLSELSVGDLAKIFWIYGEDRYSRQIAAGIEKSRKQGRSLKTTGELVALIREILPAPVQRKMGTHPARRIFQALRIYVNDELAELESALRAVEKLASAKAIIVVVSYHSLEDRIVKHTFRAWEKEKGIGAVLTRHPVVPEPGEVEANYKARSAKLRAFRFGVERKAGRGKKEFRH